MWEKFGHQSKYQKSKQDSRCFQVHSWKKGGCSQIISRMYQNVTGYTTMINMQFIMAQIHHPSSINYPKNLSSITWSSDWFHFGIERISKMAISTIIISIDALAVKIQFLRNHAKFYAEYEFAVENSMPPTHFCELAWANYKIFTS